VFFDISQKFDIFKSRSIWN